MIWSLDNKEQLQKAKLQSELELENLLAAHIEILDPNWLLLGRQIKTVSGKYIDLLCMDYSGDLIVVELKRDMTPREVTAQAIDYASCMAELKLEEVAELYSRYSGDTKSLNEAYESKYHVELNDESINCNVRMVIVASQMDTSTERIIKYLREKYGVPINILFFDVFECDGKRFISRVWFDEETPDQIPENQASNQWNQEYYVSFRSGGAGGQNVNKVESGVRLRYQYKDPYTGEEEEILIENTETRDQPKNKENALRQLRSILYDKELQHRMEEQAKVEAGKKKIEWGSQIRSYVFDDRRVKDHRTNYQTSDVNGVMDGKIDGFIKAYLMEFSGSENE